MKRLAGKVALVTGGAQGIGRAIVEAFAEEGATVAVLDRNGAGAHAVVDELRAAGVEALALAGDVTSEADVDEVVAQTLAAYGRIDVLVNNAGVAPFKPITEITLDDWNHVIATDLTGTFICTRAVLTSMLANRSGRIINIGSQLGLIGAAQMAHYCAAKSGVHGFTKALAREVAAAGITVNAVAPGPVITPALERSQADLLEDIRKEVPLKRFAEASEIAPTVVLLASDGGSYYTGAVVNVSGGHAMP